MIEISSLEILKGKKNLLAFSAGVDSSALFFLLIKQNLKFDIAIVNYNKRTQSTEEVTYAKELAEHYGLKLYTLVSPKIDKNFEARAREIRYNFFEEVIAKNSYDNLLTAHHLGDRFEWMLMQFCKGAGCIEIAGMQKFQKRDHYTLVRPLLHLDKKELYTYLEENKIKFFEDETNQDEGIQRNSFRHNYSAPLLDSYREGIKKSFEYIDQDRETLTPEIKIKKCNDFTYFKNLQNSRANIFIVDKILKSKNYMLSFKERQLLNDKKTLVVGRKFIINQNKDFTFIVPDLQEQITMTHKFKEECRVFKIEPKLRIYFFNDIEAFELVKELLQKL